MTQEKKYDLIVVGAGSGLRVAAAAAGEYGWRVAVVEEGPMGGTCLNRGCIPSKIIIHVADIIEDIKRADLFGINVDYKGVDFKKVTTRASDFVDEAARNTEKGLIDDPNIDLYKIRGEFINNKSLKVGDETITGERILIAAGTRPFVPPIPGLDKVPFITSDEALRLTVQPKKMAIIGGGYISTELGHFFGALGTLITVLERGPRLVGREDRDISEMFTKVFSGNHRVLLEHSVKRVEKDGDVNVVIAENKEGEEVRVECDTILLTTGRRSNSDLLKLENTDIKINERGFVEVNEFMETNVPGVWALGDIVGKAPFKHGANFEAEHVKVNIKGAGKKAVDYSIMPHAIFSLPQVAGVGLTEAEARDKGIAYRIARKNYIQTGMGKALEEHDGFVKFIIDTKEDKILGCHIIGPHASILVHEVVVAMKSAGGKVSAVRDAIHIHPALSEVVHWALY